MTCSWLVPVEAIVHCTTLLLVSEHGGTGVHVSTLECSPNEQALNAGASTNMLHVPVVQDASFMIVVSGVLCVCVCVCVCCVCV